eukprot:TRINITY_DN31299_c0_g1_i1.p1 TRINITY_DN31299_c0_g1~~TRINITY_DN31299_c0_g1_i1.p1  ORF type:complete len:390 (-),score=79.81 TRINITY_DN31299_c0_g1_i1:89-1258(-)
MLRHPSLKVVLIEKEKSLGAHQSSHNSGVIHSGLYYQPGSKRAKLCVSGSQAMYAYCKEKGIPADRCGKVIVAVKESELERLEMLYKRGIENGVRGLRMIDGEELKRIEPHCYGLRAIHVPDTGIVDFGRVVHAMAKDATDMGAHVRVEFEADTFTDHKVGNHTGTHIASSTSKLQGPITVRHLITCAGQWSDRVARQSGGVEEPSIIPFRGDFLKLKPEHTHLVKGMIYPVPNPAFPFLGVHFTRRINGEVWLGPNAVLAFARAGYKFSDFNLRDLWEAARHPGLRKLVWKHLRYGLGELYRDLVPAAYLEHLKPYMPSLTIEQITSGPSGVRAQAIMPDGKLVEDFVFDIPAGRSTLHVRNAPSPAATSSLTVAKEVVETAEAKLGG